MRIDELQPYMLPWDARHILACCTTLAPGFGQLGTLEPSLFPSPGSIANVTWAEGD